jgi:hypothetical protein
MDFEFPQNDPAFQAAPAQPVPPVQPPVEQNQDLPITFCVKTMVNGRHGYYLLRWSHGGLDANNKIIHIIKPANHHNNYYNISSTTRTIRWNEIVTKKTSGTITRSINWKYTNERLTCGDDRIPVIHITPMSTSLPVMKPYSFIPITVQPVQPLQPVPQLHLPVPIPPIPVEKKFPITTIPQHIVMALLRDAAMQEEVCPITSEEIDVTNGAVTSCFHLFEKNAIMQWLLMPNSRDKCPVCNTPCNSFTLDNGPPPLDTTA